MVLWKTLHVLSMVTMVTMFIGAEVFYAAAIRRGSSRELAWVQRTLEQTGVGIIGLGALAAGIVFGLLTAATGGFDFTAGWLVVAYLLVVAFLLNSAIIGHEVVAAGKAAMETEASGALDEAGAQSLAANRGVILVAINVVIFATVIVDMVARPF
jgi:uncharacterized membrane protein